MASNSVIPFELENGETVNVTLAWRYIVRLKSKSTEAYRQYNRIILQGVEDVIDQITILYAAYQCAYLHETGDLKGAMSFEDFLDVAPNDYRYVSEVAQNLLNPKYKRDSETRS